MAYRRIEKEGHTDRKRKKGIQVDRERGAYGQIEKVDR